jgi:hypothetical protein
MQIYDELKIANVSPCPLCGCDQAKYLGFISIDWDTGFTLEGVKCIRCDTIRQKSSMWCPEGMELWAKYHPDRREIKNGKVIREWSGELKPRG